MPASKRWRGGGLPCDKGEPLCGERRGKMILRKLARVQPTRRLRELLFCCSCILLVLNMPDLAWGQYSSGGYSRPGGGSGYGYSAPSRRVPVSSSGGYSRRPYSGGGYTTGSFGDRAVSRSLSAQALRQYQTAQQPAETYTRRPPAYGGGY